MARIPDVGGESEGLPELFRATFDQMIEEARKDLAVQQQRVRQMCRQRRREKRREAIRWVRTHSRGILFWSGTLACVSGTVLLVLGEPDLAMELFKIAVAAWIAAAAPHQQAQGG